MLSTEVEASASDVALIGGAARLAGSLNWKSLCIATCVPAPLIRSCLRSANRCVKGPAAALLLADGRPREPDAPPLLLIVAVYRAWFVLDAGTFQDRGVDMRKR